MINLYKVEYTTENYQPTICLFGRDKFKNKIIKKRTNFKPYFYVDVNENIEDYRIIKQEYGYKNLFDQPVKKIVVNHPASIPKVRELFQQTYEDDILFELRYMIDNLDNLKKEGIEFIGGFTEWRKCYIDIETTVNLGFPDAENPLEQITAITIYDSYEKIYHCFVWRNDLSPIIKQDKDKKMYIFNNEIDMLKEFCKIFRELNFDIITAWNIGFDLPYLINRMKEIKLFHEISSLSPINKVYVRLAGFERKFFDVVIGGIVIIDSLKLYKTLHKGELRSYSLRNVCIEELNIDKGIVNTQKEWEKTDINDLLEYNKKDVELIVMLDDKRKLLDFVNSISDISKANMEDVKYYSRVSDVLCLNYAKRNNIVLPSKRRYVKDSESYEGGYVLSNPGLYENVISLDFASLYPNILKTFNLSIETIDPEGDIDCLITRTSSKKKGIIVEVVDELINLRNRYKQKQLDAVFGSKEYYIYDATQQAAKNLYCTLGYGVNAFPSFRLYKKEVAESITAIGRELLKTTIKLVEKEGYKIILCDTDSVYIHLGDKFLTLEDNIKESDRLLKMLNEYYNKWCISKGAKNPLISIKFEKVYKRFLSITKKRYAGYITWREGKTEEGLDIAGIHARRSDVPDFTKKFQKEFLIKLLNGKPKEEILKYVRQNVKKIKNFEFSLEYISIPTKLNRALDDYKGNLPVVRGVRWSNEHLGTMFKSGDKFLLLWCKGEPDIICYEFEHQLDKINIKEKIDMPKMLDRNLYMPLETIFEALKWNLKLLQQDQSTLSKWVREEPVVALNK